MRGDRYAGACTSLCRNSTDDRYRRASDRYRHEL